MLDFIQPYVENLAELLGLDITILDEHGIRISGTGYYYNRIGEPTPEGSVYEMVLKTGKPGMIFDMKTSGSQCISCKFLHQCKEAATIGYPILKQDRPVGVIGVVGFSPEQRSKMMVDSDKLMRFLHHFGALLETKLATGDTPSTNGDLACYVPKHSHKEKRGASFDSIITSDANQLMVIDKAKRVADSLSTVLLCGESGTGKERFAQALHFDSMRSLGPFIAVNCAAIPDNLLESELFGYEGGAFTGARRDGRIGKFELADQGTLFLDEIGDMSLVMQAKLLRVLQERTVERVGGTGPIPVHVRVIAATNKNLEQMVDEGTFREDLYYRINVIPLHTLPLRERRGDVILFVNHFLQKFSVELGRPLFAVSQELKQWFTAYDWPGNVRQLENVVEYMVNLAMTDVLTITDLPDTLQTQVSAYGTYPAVRQTMAAEKVDHGGVVREGSTLGSTAIGHSSLGLDERVAEFERKILQNCLLDDKSQADKAKIARELKISLSTLYRKMEKYCLSHE